MTYIQDQLILEVVALAPTLHYKTWDNADGNYQSVSFKKNDHFVDVHVSPKGNLDYVYEIGIGSDYIEEDFGENVSLEQVEKVLNRLLSSQSPVQSSE